MKTCWVITLTSFLSGRFGSAAVQLIRVYLDEGEAQAGLEAERKRLEETGCRISVYPNGFTVQTHTESQTWGLREVPLAQPRSWTP